MNIESPKQISEEEIEKINETRKRVDDLRKTDSPYEDSVENLAKRENEFREKYKGRTDSEMANDFSTETLGKKEAEKKEFIDALTGLRARAALDIEIPQVLSQEKRKKEKCCLLMIDIDKFRDINNKYGHQSGDEAIKNVANILKASCREADVAYRYGGDEFTILLPDTDIKDVEKVIKRIKENLDKTNEEKRFGIDENVTLSIGISSVNYSENDKDKDKLIEEADMALYNVKESGRNGSREYKQGMKIKEKK